MHTHKPEQTPTPTPNQIHLPQEVNYIECQEQNLTILTQNKQKKDRHSPSNTDIIALISIHIPYVLFLTETHVAKDCVALCGILSRP